MSGIENHSNLMTVSPKYLNASAGCSMFTGRTCVSVSGFPVSLAGLRLGHQGHEGHQGQCWRWSRDVDGISVYESLRPKAIVGLRDFIFLLSMGPNFDSRFEVTTICSVCSLKI